MSRNPFRQARDNNEEVKASKQADVASLFSPLPAQANAVPASDLAHTPVPKKKKKKVVIKTPPRSPEEPTRRLSLGRQPSPPLPAEVIALKNEEGENSDSTATADSDLEQAAINTRRNSAGADPLQHPILPSSHSSAQAPIVFFSRTLDLPGQLYNDEVTGDGSDTEGVQAEARNTRAMFDVDTFKNILLNGVAPPARVDRTDSSHEDSPKPTSSYDTAKLDAEENFHERYPSITTDPALREQNSISPTQSSNSSEDDEPGDQSSLVTSRDTPTHIDRAIGPQTVSFADLDTRQGLSLGSLPNAADFIAAPFIQSGDFDKPLPPAPGRSASVTDDPVSSPGKAVPALTPPPPPASRRQGTSKEIQSNHRRSSSVVSRSSIQSDQSATATEINNPKGPPPPPSRRGAKGRSNVPISSGTSSSEASLPVSAAEKHPMSPPPAPTPRRAPSRVTPPAVGRTTSSASRSSLQALPEVPGPTNNAAPRPPPPRRKAESNRSSVDGAPLVRHASGQDTGQTSNDATEVTRDKILFDLAALQREVDELRAKAEG